MTKKYIYAAYKIVIRTLKTCFVYVLTWGSFLQISCNPDFLAPFLYEMDFRLMLLSGSLANSNIRNKHILISHKYKLIFLPDSFS